MPIYITSILPHPGISRLMSIEDWRTDFSDSDFAFLWFGAEFPYSFFGFGHPRTHQSYNNYLLMDPESGDF